MNQIPVHPYSNTGLEELTRAIETFIRRELTEPGSATTFNALALQAIKLQANGLPGYARLFDARGVQASTLQWWQDAPPIPTAAFQRLPLTLLAADRVFRSSGTLGGTESRSEHHHGNLDLYRLIIDATFPTAVLNRPAPIGSPTSETATQVPILSLIPPLEQVPDSSLSFMTDEILRRYGSKQSLYSFSDGSLDFTKALHWLAHPAHLKNSPVLLTTAIALWKLLNAQEESAVVAAWPSQLTIMETGGFKTLRFKLQRQELLQRLTSLTGLHPTRVVREYGMTELTSQAYSEVLQGEDPNTFSLPPWVRARALDPITMCEVAPGTEGLLSFLDLGNVGSAVSVLTEDLGSVARSGRTFRLHGRAANAQLRGCSLTTEALLP